jgi:hypothetical protein
LHGDFLQFTELLRDSLKHARLLIQNRLDHILLQRDPCTGQYRVSTIDICGVCLSTAFIPLNAIGFLARSRFRSCSQAERRAASNQFAMNASVREPFRW